jgi:hypothetical protein
MKLLWFQGATVRWKESFNFEIGELGLEFMSNFDSL